MKNFFTLAVLCSLMLLACHSKRIITTDSLAREQSYIVGHPGHGEPGACYMKISTPEEVRFYKVICETMLDVNQFQTGLVNAGYSIDPAELKSKKFGSTSKAALLDYQESHGFQKGIFDEATLYWLLQE